MTSSGEGSKKSLETMCSQLDWKLKEIQALGWAVKSCMPSTNPHVMASPVSNWLLTG